MNINLTIIGQSITFIVFILFCMKFVWPALIGVMEEREKRISKGLDHAAQAELDHQLAQENFAKQMREGKEQAASIVEQANKRASAIVEEAKEQAIFEADRIKAGAQAEIEREASQAREQLRSNVAVLAVAGAEKILNASVDASAHSAMLDKLAAEL